MIFPYQVKSIKLDEETIEYETYKGEIIFNTSGIPAEKAWEDFIARPKPKVTQAYHGSYCSCVTYLKAYFGLSQSIGYARNWPLNAKVGAPGGVIVLNIGRYGHVARIVAISLNGYVLDEANYEKCAHTSGRVINFDDATIKGFWNP